MKPKAAIDLIIIGAISLLTIPVVLLLSSTVPRIIVGLPFIIFCPGYAIIAALFPAKETIKGIERVAYSLALSFAIVALLGLLLNYVWEISLYPMLIVLEIEVFFALAVAWFRRYKLPEVLRFTFNINWRLPWQGKGALDTSLIILLIIVIAGAAIASVIVYNKNIQGYTEFYLLGPNGKATDYPNDLLVGEKGKVTAVIVNKERQPMRYLLRVQNPNAKVWMNDEAVFEIWISLNQNQEWKADVSFVFSQPGIGQKLEFQLFTGDGTELYLANYLKISVEE